MNSVFVYCEIEDGQVAEVSMELLTKGRSLATELKCNLEAIAIGHKLDGIEKDIDRNVPFLADQNVQPRNSTVWNCIA